MPRQETPPPDVDGQPPANVPPLASSDPEGIASASRSCLVILALGVVIFLLICVSTAIRLIWG